MPNPVSFARAIAVLPVTGTGAITALATVIALAAVVALPGPAAAQEPPPTDAQLLPAAADERSARARDDAPLTYIDCNRCDMAHIRQQVTFVNHVRDPGLAQVHVLIADQATGAGGRRYTLEFVGLGEFAGVSNTLSYVAQATDAWAEERAGLTRVIELGLVPYVARTPLAAQLRLSFDAGSRTAAEPPADRWNNWTFEVYGGGNFNTEVRQDSWNARYGFYANRVTDDWKIRLRPYFNNNARTIRRDDGDDIRISQRRHGFESYVIRSVGPHWGAGVFAEYITHTLDNIRHGVTVTPALEYSLFPYGEAATRQITFTYRVGYELADYLQETIYERTEESLVNSSLNAAVRVRQRWGSVSGGLTGSTYMHDTRYHRFTVDSNVSLRLGGGVSLNIGGNYQRINDQLSLPRGSASLEDILLQRRRLATSYRGSGNIGLSYTFGSIFTNVVNPRL
jgi:hypothetical protein